MKFNNGVIAICCIYFLVAFIGSSYGGQSDVISANNKVAMKLYRQLSETNNCIFSPYSIMMALSMVLMGCRGNTASQLVQALEYNQGLLALDIHMSLRKLSIEIQQSNNNGSLCQFNDNNCLFLQEGYPFKKAFLNNIREFYQSDIKDVNFKNSKVAADYVNGWVDKVTNHKITQLLQPGQISPLTKLILLNAIYFKGKWLLPFDKEKVIEKPFHYSQNQHVNVKMMSKKMKVNYMHDDKEGIQMIELPYACKKTSLVIILPQEIKFFDTVKRTIVDGNLNAWMNMMKKAEVKVQIPKFSVKQKMNLKNVLHRLGIHDLFDIKKADLSGISEVQSLYVKEVIQEARLDVTEEGSEAAAASAVIVLSKMMISKKIEFIANRPFIFLIRDIPSNTILFMGHLSKPES